MKLDRSTAFMLLGLVIVIVMFNYFTREGFYDNVVISGTGLTIGPITNTPPAATPSAAMPPAGMPPAATPSAATPATPTTMSSIMDLPAATVTIQPDAPLTQVGRFGMRPIATQQVTDPVGTNAVSSIQKGVVSTDSTPRAVASTRGAVVGPRMGSSMDSCSDDSCEDDCNDDGCN
jgi:hypothetical protein